MLLTCEHLKVGQRSLHDVNWGAMEDQGFCATAHDATRPLWPFIGHLQIDGPSDLPGRDVPQGHLSMGMLTCREYREIVKA